MAEENPGEVRMEAPLDKLERALIDEFLRARGHDRASLAKLSEEERDAVWREASLHASAKLSEVEARSHLLHELHDGTTGES